MKKFKYNHKDVFIFRDKLLISREKTFKILKEYINSKSFINTDTFLVISFNYPGLPKLNFNFIRSLRYLIDFFESFFFINNIISYKLIISFSGPQLIIKINKPAILLKKICYNIETQCRFFDIDVYTNENIISSNILGFEEKKCIICGCKISRCRIKNKHPKRQIRKRINFLIKEFCNKFI